MDAAVELVGRAGFRHVTLRGDTDFSQTEYLDGWDESGVNFVFGYAAYDNLVKSADSLPETAWKLLERGGGERQIQAIGDETARPWSGGKQLWWIYAAPGDVLALGLPVGEPGRYRLSAAFTKAADYGIVQVRLNGRPVGAPQDLCHDGVIHSGAVELGEVELTSGGTARLELVIAGRNPKAISRHMVGVDWLKLVPVD